MAKFNINKLKRLEAFKKKQRKSRSIFFIMPLGGGKNLCMRVKVKGKRLLRNYDGTRVVLFLPVKNKLIFRKLF